MFSQARLLGVAKLIPLNNAGIQRCPAAMVFASLINA
jgi:hypothetical protein